MNVKGRERLLVLLQKMLLERCSWIILPSVSPFPYLNAWCTNSFAYFLRRLPPFASFLLQTHTQQYFNKILEYIPLCRIQGYIGKVCIFLFSDGLSMALLMWMRFSSMTSSIWGGKCLGEIWKWLHVLSLEPPFIWFSCDFAHSIRTISGNFSGKSLKR